MESFSRQVSEVIITSDVFKSCMYHAYLTQSEEVAGLLLGFIDETQLKTSIKIYASITNQRKTKEKDRVEIHPEQLSEAMVEAEKLSAESKIDTTVVGWYHSHPNITVFPSQVDINTQYGMQMVGSQFIGLIFSVFVTNNQNQISKSEVIAFQSYDDHRDGVKKARTLKVFIEDTQKMLFGFNQITSHDFYYNIQNIQKILVQEQEQDYEESQKSLSDKNLKKLTNASQNILSYCNILDNLSHPTDVMLQSYHRNLRSTLNFLQKENSILSDAISETKLKILKVKGQKGMLKTPNPDDYMTPTPQ